MLNYIAAVALFVAPAIAVPWTNATCVDQAWSFNSQTQSPCLVAAYLAAQCTTDNTFGIYALNDGGPYGFVASAANNCLCNSVVWNLLSACALCQRELSGSWGQWVASCPSNLINVAKYPLPLPAGVAVPSWAYYDFTVAGTFNSVIASQQLGLESSAVSGATSTPASVPSSIVPSSEATLTGATGSTSVPKPITSQSASSSNTGAIIGGVVGGVLGICLIGLIAFVLTRRRKSDEPANKYPEINHKSPMASAFNGATPMAGQVPPYQFGAPNQPVSTPEYKPYDPSDPSTFPTGPATPENGHYVESLPYPYQPQGIPGQLSHPNVPQV
ncbi:unnamed protein product [Rhizoctonia solani]|uniref:Transmembrane protein n=1 Tax=Rhizoctonia solani TaxID=456999 RepID=A0A8H3HEF6_9AGAM|nr:unnamed protein product [Rhizoctonia solani]